MSFSLPPLPFSKNALAPFLSEETLEFHYEKHHRGYLEKLKKLIKGTEFEKASLEDIIHRASGDLFNNAAQFWNHSFYWNSMSPDGMKVKSEEFKNALKLGFGSEEAFKTDLEKKGMEHFGSGYAWVVIGDLGQIEIETKTNAINPLVENKWPLLTCDLWEHSYYLDYRNEKKKYLKGFIEKINWEFAEKNFLESKSRSPQKHKSMAV